MEKSGQILGTFYNRRQCKFLIYWLSSRYPAWTGFSETERIRITETRCPCCYPIDSVKAT